MPIPDDPVDPIPVLDVGGFRLDVDELDEDEGYMQVPVLGLVVTTIAAPPKSQLVGAGFF